MKKHILTLFMAAASLMVYAQASIYPAKKQSKLIAITGATIHTGTGQVIENGMVVFSNGKIISVTANGNPPADDVIVINAKGKHLYPGFIAPINNLGLVEYPSVKASVDFSEIGEYNSHIRSAIAYNTDSKVIPTLRSNGILMAQIRPQGGTISGSSSVMQLDAWNWEDALIAKDDAMHVNWPAVPRFRGFSRPGFSAESMKERVQKSIDGLNAFFNEAKAYAEGGKPEVNNSRLEGMRGVFNGSKRLFMVANTQKDIVAAVNFAKSFGITPVITGASEAYLVTDFLKNNQVSVIINQPHSLPSNNDDDVNLPYKNAVLLSNAGINVVVSIDGFWQQRNLPFMAGTVAAWGLDKEKALQTITLNAAKALGIDKKVGSIEVGKDATLFISGGDALDMRSNHVERAFIQGRDVDLDNVQKQLDKRYTEKYKSK